MNPMMPEQQSFVLYIVMGNGFKSGSRLPEPRAALEPLPMTI